MERTRTSTELAQDTGKNLSTIQHARAAPESASRVERRDFWKLFFGGFLLATVSALVFASQLLEASAWTKDSSSLDLSLASPGDPTYGDTPVPSVNGGGSSSTSQGPTHSPPAEAAPAAPDKASIPWTNPVEAAAAAESKSTVPPAWLSSRGSHPQELRDPSLPAKQEKPSRLSWTPKRSTPSLPSQGKGRAQVPKKQRRQVVPGKPLLPGGDGIKGKAKGDASRPLLDKRENDTGVSGNTSARGHIHAAPPEGADAALAPAAQNKAPGNPWDIFQALSSLGGLGVLWDLSSSADASAPTSGAAEPPSFGWSSSDVSESLEDEEEPLPEGSPGMTPAQRHPWTDEAPGALAPSPQAWIPGALAPSPLPGPPEPPPLVTGLDILDRALFYSRQKIEARLPALLPSQVLQEAQAQAAREAAAEEKAAPGTSLRSTKGQHNFEERSESEGNQSQKELDSVSTAGGGGSDPDADKARQVVVQFLQRVFGEGRRYYWPLGGADKCAGESHFGWSFLCMVDEARVLNRTYVMDLELCIPPVHSQGKGLLLRPINAYYNLKHMFSRQSMIPQPVFLLALDLLRLFPGVVNVTAKVFGVRETTPELQREGGVTVLGRDREMNRYGYLICDHQGQILRRNYGMLPHVGPLWSVANSIAASMGWYFDAVHIRRGDKLDPVRWPNVDRDTRPPALMKKLPKFIPPGKQVYISTNERTPGFFDPLRKMYRIHTLDEYAHLWNRTSDWYHWAKGVLGEDAEFDPRMQGIVDYMLLKYARRKVETFNDLTNDPKHGVQRGAASRTASTKTQARDRNGIPQAPRARSHKEIPHYTPPVTPSTVRPQARRPSGPIVSLTGLD